MQETKNKVYCKYSPQYIPSAYTGSHLAPPEKGRNEWLCRGESGANLEGSNTCRETAPQSEQVEVNCNPQGDNMPRGGNNRRYLLVLRPTSLPSLGVSYLWVWPHLRVVVETINGECDLDTCRGRYEYERRWVTPRGNSLVPETARDDMPAQDTWVL